MSRFKNQSLDCYIVILSLFLCLSLSGSATMLQAAPAADYHHQTQQSTSSNNAATEPHSTVSQRKSKGQTNDGDMAAIRSLLARLAAAQLQAAQKAGHINDFEPVDGNRRKNLAKNGVDSLVNLLLSMELQQRQSEQLEQLEQYQQLAKNSLKRKWHKLLDDLIDDEFAGSNQDKLALLDRLESSAVSQDNLSTSLASPKYKRKVAVDKLFQKDLQKRPELESSNAVGLVQPLNQLDLQQQQQQQLADRDTQTRNTNDHTKRILDDKFGILKESIFTTNNHLGHKSVPKFGSDEEF